MAKRVKKAPIREKREETHYTASDGTLMKSVYCDHCDGLMKNCPKCSGKGVLNEAR